MTTIAEVLQPTHAPQSDSTLSAHPDAPAQSEQLFDGHVLYLPFRATLDHPQPTPCWGHDPVTPPVCTDQPLAVVDWLSRLGGWRRELVCRRHLIDFLEDRRRDSDVVLCWLQSTSPHAMAEPLPLGQLAQWPVEATGGAA